MNLREYQFQVNEQLNLRKKSDDYQVNKAQKHLNQYPCNSCPKPYNPCKDLCECDKCCPKQYNPCKDLCNCDKCYIECDTDISYAQFLSNNNSISNIVLSPGEHLNFTQTLFVEGTGIKLNKKGIKLKQGLYNISFTGFIASSGQISLKLNNNIINSAFTNSGQLNLSGLIRIDCDENNFISIINPVNSKTDTIFQVINSSGIVSYPYIIIMELPY